ncbi:UNVERIFIED_CONTAM: hypothetical protein RMT77_007334 [Armadillidium vulgare]
MMTYVGVSDLRNISITFPEEPHISTSDLNEACEIALIEMKDREIFERDLVRRNIFAVKGSSVFWHARLFQTNERIITLGQDAILVLLASISLVKRFTIRAEHVLNVLSQHSVTNTIIKDTCPSSPPCAGNYRYRTFDGSCNNLLHRDWGTTGTYFRRLIYPYYADGVSVPRQALSGHLLPSARRISSRIHIEKPSQNNKFTLLLMQWGQFLDHDLILTPIAKGSAYSDISCCDFGKLRTTKDMHPECYPIQIPEDDSFYSQFDQNCMEFVRSLPAIRPKCSFGPREQMNQVSSYIDGSTIYGSSHEEAKQLRTFRKGRLKTSRFKGGSRLLPRNPSECRSKDNEKSCFKAGDVRVNEQIQLTTMHTIWVRQHNLIVRKLSRQNRHWNDERLFQEGRRIIIAQIQHITYNEFLPILLGKKFMNLYGLFPLKHKYFEGYRDNVDATIANVFGTAAFRFGHTLVTDHFRLYDNDGKFKGKLDLKEVQFAPYALYDDDGVACLARGLIRQKPRTFDRFFTKKLTEKLFAGDLPFGLDLVALNIQRGRDHGLPPYVKWREYCGLKPAYKWEDLSVDMDDEVIAELQSVYDDIEDVDLYVGGVSEKPLTDSIVGPTFFCIIAKQFIKLKIGDRFYYENSPDNKYNRNVVAFTQAQLYQIRKTSFARVLCSAVKSIGSVQPLTFISTNSLNKRVSCRGNGKIPYVNLRPWKMTIKTNGVKSVD